MAGRTRSSATSSRRWCWVFDRIIHVIPTKAGISAFRPRDFGFRRNDGDIGEWIEWISPIPRSEEHTSELQSLMRISYAVFCLKKKKKNKTKNEPITRRL